MTQIVPVGSEDGLQRLDIILDTCAATIDVLTGRLLSHAPIGPRPSPIWPLKSETPVFSPRFVTPASDGGIWPHLCEVLPNGHLSPLLDAPWVLESATKDGETAQVLLRLERPDCTAWMQYLINGESVEASLRVSTGKEIEVAVSCAVRVSNAGEVGLEGAGGESWDNLAILTSGQGIIPTENGNCSSPTHARNTRPVTRVLSGTTDTVVPAEAAGGHINVRDTRLGRIVRLEAARGPHLRVRKVMPEGGAAAGKESVTVSAGLFAVEGGVGYVPSDNEAIAHLVIREEWKTGGRVFHG